MCNRLCLIFSSGFENLVNRLPVASGMLKKQEMCKKKKGFYVTKVTDGGIVAVQCKDNGIVTLASNRVGVNLVHTAQRYSVLGKKKIPVKFPKIVSAYNRNMGGVDRMDENISLYRISIRGGKNGIFP